MRLKRILTSYSVQAISVKRCTSQSQDLLLGIGITSRLVWWTDIFKRSLTFFPLKPGDTCGLHREPVRQYLNISCSHGSNRHVRSIIWAEIKKLSWRCGVGVSQKCQKRKKKYRCSSQPSKELFIHFHSKILNIRGLKFQKLYYVKKYVQTTNKYHSKYLNEQAESWLKWHDIHCVRTCSGTDHTRVPELGCSVDQYTLKSI